MLAVVFVLCFGIVLMLGNMAIVAWDWSQDRHFQRRMEILDAMTYRSYIDNCTARRVEPKPFRVIARTWR